MTSRPLNFIHANAYPASDAITSGKTVAGIEIAIELKNGPSRLSRPKSTFA